MLLLKFKEFSLPFEFPFTISKGTKTHQPTLILSLSLGSRFTGYGEATSIAYYNANIEEMIVLLQKNKRAIESYALNGPERFWHFLHHLLPEQNFLIAALDTAGWDLWAQMNHKPLHALIGLQWKNIPETDYTIGINHVEDVLERIKQKPYSIYKIKVGSENDLATIEAISKTTNATLRVDANEGWTLNDAKYIVKELNNFNIDCIEQPLHRDDTDGVLALKELTNIPIIADEACQNESQAELCLKIYDGINVKLSKCGGITPAINIIKKIKAARKKLMLGGMCETNVGATALAHLLPLADFADIDGPLLLAQNIGKGLSYQNGLIGINRLPGLGISDVNL